jgi:hypothetical protein
LAVALLGSAARQSEDEWSDIDLAVRLAPDAALGPVARDWTEWLASLAEMTDHLDIHAWGALYRVFLCRNGLQIDLSLWPWDKFRPVNGEPMRLVFGDCLQPELAPQGEWAEYAKMAWLYALHAHSAIRRGRALQADLMLTNWRERIMSLAALRHSLNPAQGRGAHLLPDDVQDAIERSRPADLRPDELHRALAQTADLYLAELRHHDLGYADKLAAPMAAMAR